MVAGIEKVLEWLALYHQPFLQKEDGFAERQGAAFDGVAVIRPFGAEFLLNGLPAVRLLRTQTLDVGLRGINGCQFAGQLGRGLELVGRVLHTSRCGDGLQDLVAVHDLVENFVTGHGGNIRHTVKNALESTQICPCCPLEN